MKLSFLVTYYNQQEFVADSMRSVAELKKPCEYEVLVGDDGSVDNSVAEVEKWREHFGDHLQIFKMSRDDGNTNPVVRASNLRRFLLKQSTGDYFCVLDGDDYYCDRMFITDALWIYKNHPDISVVMFDYQMVYPDCIKKAEPLPKEGFIESNLYIRNYYKHAGCCVFKKISDMNYFLRITKALYYDDNDITIYNLSYGNLWYKNRTVYSYRQHEDSIWNSMGRARQGILNLLGADNGVFLTPAYRNDIYYRFRGDILYAYFRRFHPVKYVGDSFYKEYLSLCQKGFISKRLLQYHGSTEQERSEIRQIIDTLKEQDPDTYIRIKTTEKNHMNNKTRETWERTIRETVYSTNYVGCEIIGNLQVAVSYAQIWKADVYLFGTEANMDCFTKYFLHEGLRVKAIIDRFERNVGKTILQIPVISLSNLVCDVSDPENTVIFCFSEMEKQELESFKYIADRAKIQQIFYFDSLIRSTITTNCVEEWDRNRIVFYQDTIEDLIDLLPYYEDEESFQVMNEYIRTYSERDVYRKIEIPSKYKYFYDMEGRKIYTHLTDEVWLNFGASTGDNLFTFFRNGLIAKKIYAVEAETERYDQLVKNILLLPTEMRKTIIPKNVFVDINTDLNSLVDHEQLTLINADIEGYELEMLQILADKIKKDRPVLAICLYHKKEDLIHIPSYILNLYDGYKFYLRKYAYCWGNINRNQELVLYAVPPTRKEK